MLVGLCAMRTAVSTLLTFCPPFPPLREGVDLQIDRVNFYRCGIGDLRDNIDAGKGSVTAFVRIERRDAHQTEHAALGLKMTVC